MWDKIAKQKLRNRQRKTPSAPIRILDEYEYRNWVQEQIATKMFRRLAGIVSLFGISTLIGLFTYVPSTFDNAIDEEVTAKFEKFLEKADGAVDARVGNLILSSPRMTEMLENSAKSTISQLAQDETNRIIREDPSVNASIQVAIREKLNDKQVAELVDRTLEKPELQAALIEKARKQIIEAGDITEFLVSKYRLIITDHKAPPEIIALAVQQFAIIGVNDQLIQDEIFEFALKSKHDLVLRAGYQAFAPQEVTKEHTELLLSSEMISRVKDSRLPGVRESFRAVILANSIAFPSPMASGLRQLVEDRNFDFHKCLPVIADVVTPAIRDGAESDEKTKVANALLAGLGDSIDNFDGHELNSIVEIYCAAIEYADVDLVRRQTLDFPKLLNHILDNDLRATVGAQKIGHQSLRVIIASYIERMAKEPAIAGDLSVVLEYWMAELQKKNRLLAVLILSEFVETVPDNFKNEFIDRLIDLIGLSIKIDAQETDRLASVVSRSLPPIHSNALMKSYLEVVFSAMRERDFKDLDPTKIWEFLGDPPGDILTAIVSNIDDYEFLGRVIPVFEENFIELQATSGLNPADVFISALLTACPCNNHHVNAVRSIQSLTPDDKSFTFAWRTIHALEPSLISANKLSSMTVEDYYLVLKEKESEVSELTRDRAHCFSVFIDCVRDEME